LPALDAYCITGELALSGQLRPFKGVLSIALEARRRGRQTLVVPLENAAEASIGEGV
jgi:magnesium chelatase family protein